MLPNPPPSSYHFRLNETHLNDSFQALGSLNGSQRPQHAEDSQDLQHRDVARHPGEEDGDERDADHEDVEEVGGGPHVAAPLHRAVRQDLQHDLEGEHGREEVIKVSQHSIPLGIGVQWILSCQRSGGYQNTTEKEVADDGVIDEVVAENTELVLWAEDEENITFWNGEFLFTGTARTSDQFF